MAVSLQGLKKHLENEFSEDLYTVNNLLDVVRVALGYLGIEVED